MKYTLILLLLTSCSSGGSISDKNNTWVIDNVSYFGVFHKSEYYYCIANENDKHQANPVCYQATKDIVNPFTQTR